jgi:hypothetical protein
MKYPISIVGLMSICLITNAQSSSSLSALPSVIIHLKEPGALAPGAFSRFDILDQRADTTLIGLHTFIPTLGHSRPRQLVFQQPAASEIAGYLNKSFARSDASWSALIVLRSLWLSDASYLSEEKTKEPHTSAHRTHIRLKAEIYAFNGSFYIPIMRFDTLQTYKRGNPYNNLATYYTLWANDLSAIFSEMTDSASRLVLARIGNGRHLELTDIRQFNQSRFEQAITIANSPAPGVYTSFQEFRDNAPSIQNFEIQRENLYLRDANGASSFSHDVWGCSDGKSVFIMRDGKLYPLWKEGKAFYFINDLAAIQRIYSVDMDTGTIY